MKDYRNTILFTADRHKGTLDVDISDLRGGKEKECIATVTGHAAHEPTAATWDCVGEPKPPTEDAPCTTSLAELAHRFLAVAMAGKDMVGRDRRLHCLCFVYAPSLVNFRTIGALATGLGMSTATCWRLVKKVQTEMALVTKAQ